MNDNLPIIKICEKCGASFSCNANEIEKCFCYSIILSKEAISKINTEFSNCLCEKCLIHYSEIQNYTSS